MSVLTFLLSAACLLIAAIIYAIAVWVYQGLDDLRKEGWHKD